MGELIDGGGETESREPKEEAESHGTSDLSRESEYLLERNAHARPNVGGGLLEELALVGQDQAPPTRWKSATPSCPSITRRL